MASEAVTPEPREVLPHVRALDGVRGLAILSVLLHHVLWSNNHTGSQFLDLVVSIRGAGWVGVDLFFALSGFLITGILFDSLHDPHFFKNFYARRVLRIFPLYYGTILVLALVFHGVLAANKEPFLLLLGYLQNTSLWWHMKTSPEILSVTGHLWSLAVEEQFYLVWPLLVWLVRDRRVLLWLCVGLSLCALSSRLLLVHSGAALEATYKLAFCRADSLLSGAWLALAVRGSWRTRILRAAPIVFAVTVLACCWIAWSNHGFDWQQVVALNQYGYSILAVASASLVAMALRPASKTERILQATWLRFLGKYSYGIYTYHQLIVALLAATIAPMLLQHIHRTIVFRLTLSFLVIVVTLILSYISFHLYERPFLKLKRFFNYDTARAVVSRPAALR